MKRTSIPHLLLAASLALLLPLEQVHCACPGSQAHAAGSSPRASHSCCASKSPAAPMHAAQHPQAPRSCSCPHITSAAVPVAIEAGPQAPTVAPLAVLAVAVVVAPVSLPTGTTPALDVGSPPLPGESGAHRLRAPPVSA